MMEEKDLNPTEQTEPTEEHAENPNREPSARSDGFLDIGKRDATAKTKKGKKKSGDGSDEPFFKNKKNVIRLVMFVLAFAIAVSAFAIGISQWTRKDPGYYSISVLSDEALPAYAAGIHLDYYLTGSSNEIRVQENQLKEDFMFMMKDTFRRLDCSNTYDGIDSVGYINRSVGKTVQADAELLDILEDAYEKTRAGRGYNMFAGIYYRFWDSLLYSMDPSSLDPAVNAEQANLLKSIGDLTDTLSNFTLDIDREKGTVRFDYAEEIRQLIEEYDFESTVLDLNVLHDAYRLDLLKQKLEAKGWTNGRLYTDDGLSVSLSGNSGASFYFYQLTDGTPYGKRTAYVNGGGGTNAALVRSFAFDAEEPGFYTVRPEGKSETVLYRHKFMTCPPDGGYARSVLTVSDDLSVADLCAEGIAALRSSDLKSLKELLQPVCGKAVVLVSVAGKDGVLYTSDATAVSFDYEGGIELDLLYKG